MQCCQAKVSKIIEQNFHSNLTRILIFQQFNFLQQIWYYEKARRSYSTLGYIETNLYVKGTYKTGAYSFLAALGLDEFMLIGWKLKTITACVIFIHHALLGSVIGKL